MYILRDKHRVNHLEPQPLFHSVDRGVEKGMVKQTTIDQQSMSITPIASEAKQSLSGYVFRRGGPPWPPILTDSM